MSCKEMSGQEMSGQDISCQKMCYQEMTCQEMACQDISCQEMSRQEMPCQKSSGCKKLFYYKKLKRYPATKTAASAKRKSHGDEARQAAGLLSLKSNLTF